MKTCIQLYALILFAGWLTACTGGITPVLQPDGTSLPTTSPTPVPPEILSTPTSAQAVFDFEDARFTRSSLPIRAGALASADFNSDGHLDLVIADEPQVTILLGDGMGAFTEFGQSPSGIQPDELSVNDLDEDGDIDIIIANHDTYYLTILHNDGSGTFKPAANSPFIIELSPHPHVVQSADIDTDGHLDLLVDHRDGEGLLIFKGLGDGNFEKPGTLVEVGGDPYRGMAIGDINGDSKLDLVTPNPREVGVVLNTSEEHISFSKGDPVKADAPFGVALGDFNGDRHLDLIAALDEGSSLVELYAGDSTGLFTQMGGSPVDFAPGAKKIQTGDFNGDGIEDAVITSYQSSDVLVILGGENSVQSGYLPGGEHPWAIAAGDYNQDGKDDLVIADDTQPQLSIYLSFED